MLTKTSDNLHQSHMDALTPRDNKLIKLYHFCGMAFPLFCVFMFSTAHKSRKFSFICLWYELDLDPLSSLSLLNTLLVNSRTKDEQMIK